MHFPIYWISPISVIFNAACITSTFPFTSIVLRSNVSGKQLVAKILSINTAVYFLITPWEESGEWMIDGSGISLFLASFPLFHHWGWLEFEVWGREHKQAFTPSLHAPHASGDTMFVSRAAASVCMSISLLSCKIVLLPNHVQISFVTAIILMYFLFCGFLVQDHREGPHAAGLKPLALFRDSTSHAVWKGSPAQCLLTAWQELPVRQVSTGGAHRDVWRLMYCWICCSTGGGRRRGTRERRRGLRAVVWEDEMEMYGVSDRCKIWDGRGKGGNDLRG